RAECLAHPGVVPVTRVATSAQEIKTGDRQVACEVDFLRHVAKTNGWRPLQPAFTRNRTDQRTEQDGLSRSVRADHRDRFAAQHTKRNVFQNRCWPEPNGQPVDLKNGLGCGHSGRKRTSSRCRLRSVRLYAGTLRSRRTDMTAGGRGHGLSEPTD